MVTPSKVIQLSSYQKLQGFSQPSQNSEKITPESDSEKIPETPENKGVSAIPETPLKGNSGEWNSPAKKPEKKPGEQAGNGKPAKHGNPAKHTKPAPKAHLSTTPLVTASSGPDGYKADCAAMTPGQLQAAYKSEYQSWKNSKSRCKTKGWPWASEWESFNGFLLSMGPKPTPAHTLDRIESAVGAYGPDLCRWADKHAQNNNKSDNIKFVIPLIGGEVWTPQKLAKLHGVQVQTVYKWIANNYSPVELLAGKKVKPLLALSLALDEWAASQPPKGKKAPVQLKIPDYRPPTFDNEPEPTDEEWNDYLDTGKLKCKGSHQLHRAEYDALVEWAKRYNAGLPVSPTPPQVRYYNVILPPDFGKPKELLPPKPKAIPYDPDAYDEDEDFDPADCMPDPDMGEDD